MTAVTAFGSSVCNYTKGELLIRAANRCLLRPDAHQRGFFGLINFGSGLTLRESLLNPISDVTRAQIEIFPKQAAADLLLPGCLAGPQGLNVGNL